MCGGSNSRSAILRNKKSSIHVVVNFDNETADEALLIFQEEIGAGDTLAAPNAELDLLSSDEEKVCQSQKKKSPNKDQDFQGAFDQVVKDHFNGRQSRCDKKDLECRFQCPKAALARTHDGLMGVDPFIQKEKENATKKLDVCNQT